MRNECAAQGHRERPGSARRCPKRQTPGTGPGVRFLGGFWGSVLMRQRRRRRRRRVRRRVLRCVGAPIEAGVVVGAEAKPNL